MILSTPKTRSMPRAGSVSILYAAEPHSAPESIQNLVGSEKTFVGHEHEKERCFCLLTQWSSSLLRQKQLRANPEYVVLKGQHTHLNLKKKKNKKQKKPKTQNSLLTMIHFVTLGGLPSFSEKGRECNVSLEGWEPFHLEGFWQGFQSS